MLSQGLLLLVCLAALALVYLAYRYLALKGQIEERARERYERWREQELSAMRGHYEQIARAQAEVQLGRWRQEYEDAIRKDAVEKSRAVTVGKVTEHVVPYLPDFRHNPKDARFIGTPVDFIVFDGLDEGAVRKVAFVEVKTGSSSLNTRERRVRDAVRRGAVEWEEIHVSGIPPAPSADEGEALPPTLADKACPDCGHRSRDPARFCGRCGGVLAGP